MARFTAWEQWVIRHLPFILGAGSLAILAGFGHL